MRETEALIFATCEFSSLSHWKKKKKSGSLNLYCGLSKHIARLEKMKSTTGKGSTSAEFLLGPPKSGQKWEERAKTHSRSITTCLHEKEPRRGNVVWLNFYHLSTSITNATNWKHSENELDPPKSATISLLLRKNLRNRSVSYVRG